jgi:hypothetical protein
VALKAYRVLPGINAELDQLAREAEPTVEYVVGEQAERVEAQWEPAADTDDGPVARLTLTYAGVSQSNDFTAWDFAEPSDLRWRVRRVWDRLLAERIRQLQAAVRASLAADEGE